MSKDQVSGSVTLSLGGLADGLADRLAPMFEQLAADILKISTPALYAHAGIVGVLTGYGVAYELADHVAREMAASGKAMINVAPPEQVPDEPVIHVGFDRPGPAETFFREGL